GPQRLRLRGGAVGSPAPRDPSATLGFFQQPASGAREIRSARSGGIGAPGEARRRGIAEAIARRSNEARRRETARDRAANFPGGTLAMFTGAMTALVTPFHGGEVDTRALEAMVEAQI